METEYVKITQEFAYMLFGVLNLKGCSDLAEQLRSAPAVVPLDLEKVKRWDAYIDGDGVLEQGSSHNGKYALISDLQSLVQPEQSVKETCSTCGSGHEGEEFGVCSNGFHSPSPVSVPTVEEIGKELYDVCRISVKLLPGGQLYTEPNILEMSKAIHALLTRIEQSKRGDKP